MLQIQFDKRFQLNRLNPWCPFPDMLVHSPLIPAKAGTQAFFWISVRSAALERVATKNTNTHERGQSYAQPERERSCSFVFFVAQKTWVPAFAGMSGKRKL